MKVNQVQLFTNGYAVRCETFACGEPGMYFIGRPDAPYNTNYVMCPKCAEELVESIKEQFSFVVVPEDQEYLDALLNNSELNSTEEKRKELEGKMFEISGLPGETFGQDTSSIVSQDANGFRIQTDGELNLTGNVDLANQDGKVDFSNGVHLFIEDGAVITPDNVETFIVGDAPAEPLKMPKPKDFDLDEALKDARSHKELDEIVSHLSLTNVPPKEDAEGNKATMDQRKAAILSNFLDDVE